MLHYQVTATQRDKITKMPMSIGNAIFDEYGELVDGRVIHVMFHFANNYMNGGKPTVMRKQYNDIWVQVVDYEQIDA